MGNGIGRTGKVEMNDLLEIKESLIKHLHIENSRANLNFDECAACAYRPSEQDTCDNLIPLLDGALSMIIKLEPHVIKLSEIEDGGGYWLTMISSNFKSRPVICVHNEKDAGKPYITLAWQYGTTSLEAEAYGILWRLWSAKPIGREW